MIDKKSKKNLFIKTYGCQMNSYDSDRINESLEDTHTLVNEVNQADLIILNTCHIREKAAEKLYSDLGRIVKSKDKVKSPSIVVAGCVAQAEGKEIQKRQPKVDIVIGPQMYHLIPNLIDKLEKKKTKKIIEIEFPEENKFDKLKNPRTKVLPSSFVSVQEGCDKFCSFCVVPFTRGSEYSRSVNDVYEEILSLSNKGAKEVILLGQNVNAYHGLFKDKTTASLSDLILQISKIQKIKRISYTTSHPNEMSDELIMMHGTNKKLNSYLHLPVQSGSDKVLKKMNRKYTVSEYIKIIEKLRKVKPGIALSSDFIVGFPGETEEDFKKTINLVRLIGFTQAYSFTYSPRPGTGAASLENQIPVSIKKERLQRLQDILNDQQWKFNLSFENKEIEILLTRKGKKDGQLIGSSLWMQSVHIENSESRLDLEIGKIIKVRIISAGPKSLRGKFIRVIN